jgi:hypothetical protein
MLGFVHNPLSTVRIRSAFSLHLHVPQGDKKVNQYPIIVRDYNHAELTSRITYTLDAVGETTKLTLVNDQFTENHPSFERSEDNWAVVVSNLKSYAETGKTLNFGW